MKKKSSGAAAAALAASAAFLLFPAQAAQGAREGLGYALGVLIPSLYPFLVLSVFLAKSGAFRRMGRLLEKPARVLFRLPGSAAAAVLMSAAGGYPVGARMAAELCEEGSITRAQAERMALFCVNAGPSFLVTAVGVGFYRSPRAGWTLFAAQLISFFALGIFSGLRARREPEPAGKSVPPARAASGAFVASAADAGRSVLMMCGMVILFAAGVSLLRQSVRSQALRVLLSALLEVTGGCADLARCGAPLWAAAAAAGWGGVCVHFQIFACLGKLRVSRRRFVLWRAAQSVLSGAVCLAAERLFPETAEVFSSFGGQAAGELSGSIPAAALLALLCAALLFSLPHKKVEIAEGR